MVRQVTQQTRAEMSAAFGPDTVAFLGTGLFFKGLGIARNMPSFKKVGYFFRGSLITYPIYQL